MSATTRAPYNLSKPMVFSQADKDHIMYTLETVREYMKERAQSRLNPETGMWEDNEEEELKIELENAIETCTEKWRLY